MALKYVMINDIIEEHNARMQNLRKYYPFFALAETTFTQYKEGRYADLDMGYITMAVLRFLIHENNFNEREVSFEEYEEFMSELLNRDFDVEILDEDRKELISYIFDKIKNDGRAFQFSFYDPGTKQKKTGRVKLIDSRIRDGKVFYFITADGIEFYLDTKEIKDESQISVQQLLLEKMITGENFKGGIEVVRRINGEVNKLIRQKDDIVDLLSYDVFKGAEEYESYMKRVGKWFEDEQKLFAKNKALVDKAIAKASFDNMNGGNARTLTEISELELELKNTIIKHGSLISSTMELQNISDNIIHKAKLKKLRPAFDFNERLKNIVKEDAPEKLLTILSPLFLPKRQRTFSMKAIDNMLTLKADDGSRTVEVKKEKTDLDFVYEDEILDAHIAMNFAKLFFELMERIMKWDKLTLREFNGILEIKFGKEIYENADYYSFLAHLAQKKEYDISKLMKKQDTMLEGMVAKVLSGHMDNRILGRLSKENIDYELDSEGAKAEYLAPELSFEKFKDLRFSLTFNSSEKIELGDGSYVTDMIFERMA